MADSLPPDGPIPQTWGQVVSTYDEKHTAAHERIRIDLEKSVSMLGALTATVDRNYRYFEDQNAALRLRINTVEQLAQRPIAGEGIVWTTKAIATVFSAAVIVASAFIWVRFDLQQIHSEMLFATAQYESVRKSIDELRKQREDDKKEAQQKLSDFLNQSLEKTIISNGRGGRK